MRKLQGLWLIVILSLSLVFVACGSSSDTTVSEERPAEETTDNVVEEESATEEMTEEEMVEEETGADSGSSDKVQIRWFVGLGTGSNEDQIEAQDAVVARFNESQDEIELLIEYVDNEQATDILNTQIAAGNSPDIIGPVGVAGRAAFTDVLLDLQPLIDANDYDLSDFDPAMVDFYELEGKGQIGLPFGIFPSFVYFNKDLFDEAGLPYPPQEYGQPYVLDGTEMAWDMNTVAEIAKRLTVDANGADATMSDFDPENIVQFGYGVQYTDIRGRLTLFGPDAFHDGEGNAEIPEQWREAANWYHNAMWKEHFMPNAVYGGSDILNAGNWFESGNIAMVHVHLWYATCCTSGLDANWDIAVMPAAPDGTITAKMHADTFAILEGTEHPEEAFAVLTYLLGDAANDLTQTYGGLPARISLQDAYFDTLNTTTFADQEINWSVATASMAYPDNPNHEEAYPNELVARDALAIFTEQLDNDPNFDVDAGLEELQASLQEIFDAAD